LTRPRKQTVDYFPHDCVHGNTMFIIEQRYGNDGYAFWFKLLELLGKATGHYLDLNKITALEFLASVTRVPPDTCIEILDLLARLEAIDTELWESKIIWSDNFVKGITDAYRNRVLETPIRPDNLRKKPPISRITDDENPQMKVNESKGKEIKDMSSPIGEHGSYSSDFLTIYSAYPKNQRGSKKNAYVQFKKLKAQIPLNITEIIERQIQEKRKADSIGMFCPEFKHLERWLKAQSWENEPLDFKSGGKEAWYE
jgi:hypothetical protein